LSQLASFEQKHHEKLQSQKESLQSDKRYLIQKNRPGESFENDQAIIIEIMNMAIESAERTQKAYTNLTEKIDDPEWKYKFRELVE